MKIHQLSQETQSQLTSGYHLPTFSQAIQELVENSVQAQATSIKIAIDLKRLSFSVRDNGRGIDPKALEVYIGERNATSSVAFDAGGKSLNSLAQVAKVTIRSRRASSWNTYSKEISYGSLIFMGRRGDLREAGTLIQVHGLYGQLPVRQKALVQDPQYQRTTLSDIRLFCIRLAMMHLDISVELTNLQDRRVELQLPAADTLKQRLVQLYDKSIEREFHDVMYEDQTLKLEGVFKFQSKSDKSLQLQHLFINRNLKIQTRELAQVLEKEFNKAIVKKKKTQSVLFVLNLEIAKSTIDHLSCREKAQQDYPQLFHNFVQSLITRTFPSKTTPSRVGLIRERKRKRTTKEEKYFKSANGIHSYRVPAPVTTPAKVPRNQKLQRHELQRFVRRLYFPTLHQPEESKFDKLKKILVPKPSPPPNRPRLSPCACTDSLEAVHPTQSIRSIKATTVTKELLHEMSVINQVDSKFILLRTKTQVFCMDQHAADERVKLEHLEDLFFGKSRQEQHFPLFHFANPLPIELTSHQHSICLQYQATLRKWGFKVQLQPPTQSSAEIDLLDNLPTWYHSENTLLHIIYLETLPSLDGTCPPTADFVKYLDQLDRNPTLQYQIPVCLQRILHSKACRSAIMFGDDLSIEDCQTIIDNLKHCHFPFQCAHGRPSIVPLIEL